MANDNTGIAPGGEASDFAGCLARTNPSAGALEQLRSQPDETPVIMLNLLRFRPRGDASLYGLYVREAKPEIARLGSSVGYFGRRVTDIATEPGLDDSWDAVALIVYPRRDSYLQLQESGAYQLAIPYRVAATQRRNLYVLGDGSPLVPDAQTVADLDASHMGLTGTDTGLVTVELLRFTTDGREQYGEHLKACADALLSVGGQTLLSVDAEIPVLSDEYWHHCLLRHYPSRDALLSFYQSEDYRTAEKLRTASLEKSLCIATESVSLPA
ncbi:MAG: DUF1330 domain-containing protein [Halieaceae bacterium]